MKPKQLPHEGVYTRLKSSLIHGVGVFAIRQIPRGTRIFADDEESIIWVSKTDIENLSEALKALYDDFAVIDGDRYGCPRSFNALTPAWYLNHSSEPNVACGQDYSFYALRDINADEELTVDYRTYSDLPKHMMSLSETPRAG